MRELVQTAPEKVTLVIDSKPSGVRVYREADGVRLGVTPLTFQVDKGRGQAAFILRHPDFRSETVSIPINSDSEHLVKLDPRRIGVARPPAIEDNQASTEVGKPDPSDSNKKAEPAKRGKGRCH